MSTESIENLKELNQWVCWDRISGRKTPICPYGGAASSTKSSTWGSYTDALEACNINGYDGIGFVFSDSDQYCGVDIDNCIDETGSVTEEAKSIIDHLDSYTEISPSGKGVKIFGRCDSQYKGRNEGGLEYYTKGRFFTFTGDCVSDNDNLSDMSEWFAEKHVGHEEYEIAQDVPEESYGNERLERADTYLSKMPPSIEGQGGDQALYVAAMRLVQDFNLSKHDAVNLLMSNFNPRCQPPWDMSDIEYKVEMAMSKRRADMLGRGNEEQVKVTVTEADEFSAGLLINRKQEALPDRLTWLPEGSPMQDMFDYIMTTNARENRSLAFSGALAWYCALIGGKVMDESGVTSNLYTITLAPSSGGKQAPQDAIRAVTDASEYGDWLGGKVTSDSAIGSILQKTPNAFCLWDEVGLFLQKSKTGVQSTITDLLLDLWGATNSKFRLKQYADGDRDIVIDKPCFGFAGWSTAEHFWAGLTKMHLHDGFAGRLFVINTGERAPRKRKVYQEAPRSLVGVTNFWNKPENVFQESGLAKKPRCIMKVSEEAEEVFDALWDKVEEFTENDEQAVWGRAPEKARKIALAFAATKGPKAVVSGEHSRRACDLVEYVTEAFMAEAKMKLTGGETEQDVRRDILTELKRRNGTSYYSPLIRAVNSNSTTFDRAIRTMEDTGQIKVVHEDSGRRKVVYSG